MTGLALLLDWQLQVWQADVHPRAAPACRLLANLPSGLQTLRLAECFDQSLEDVTLLMPSDLDVG